MLPALGASLARCFFPCLQQQADTSDWLQQGCTSTFLQSGQHEKHTSFSCSTPHVNWLQDEITGSRHLQVFFLYLLLVKRTKAAQAGRQGSQSGQSPLVTALPASSPYWGISPFEVHLTWAGANVRRRKLLACKENPTGEVWPPAGFFACRYFLWML